MIKPRGPDHVTAVVNVPMPRELAVQVKDAGGKPVKDNWVTFTAKPSDSFEFAGGQLYAVVKTDERGIASVRGTPRVTRQLRINAEAADGLGNTDFTIDVREEDGTMVQQAGSDIVVIDGGGTRPTTHIPMWPVAAMVIAAMVIGGALWLFGRGTTSGPNPTPVVIREGGGSGVDNVARADAAVARAGVEAAKQELGLAIDTGLAENAAHDQGYAREYTRPVLQQLRQASVTARQVREHVSTADGKPAICGIDPSLSACRE